MSPAPLCQAEASSPTLLTHCSLGPSLRRTAPDYHSQAWAGWGGSHVPELAGFRHLYRDYSFSPAGNQGLGTSVGKEHQGCVGLLDVREGPGILRYV